MKYKLYTIEGQFIEEISNLPINFTGMIEHSFSSKEWRCEGKLHRLDGPAIECYTGSKYWYVDGQCHRLDGPAYEYSNGDKNWFIHNKQVSEEQHKLLVDIMKLKGLI